MIAFDLETIGLFYDKSHTTKGPDNASGIYRIIERSDRGTTGAGRGGGPVITPADAARFGPHHRGGGCFERRASAQPTATIAPGGCV
ncbi:hypothetical protein RV134_240063 [Roseovarius sp. EC-HK134]|nr:hypothetical protein RV134_240063 [Roseovarius sp. EC-HK134]VVT03898.1 hypothetical protein RV420_270161 [Roseovarius sp. EC-SD190]